jgi:hypothetical protein
VTVAVLERNQPQTPLTYASASFGVLECDEDRPGDRTAVLVETLRTAFVRAGVRESHSEAQEGFFVSAGASGEVCLEYNEVEREGRPAGAALVRRRDVAVLNCCDELARHGYAFTLFLSPRTLSLTVRTDG